MSLRNESFLADVDGSGQCFDEILQEKSVSERPVVLHSRKSFLTDSENWIYPQVSALTRYEGHVVTAAVENVDSYSLPAHRLHVSPALISGTLNRLFRALGRTGYIPRYSSRRLQGVGAAILHSHFGNQAYFDLSLARALKLPHVVTFYGYDLSRLPRIPVWRDRFAELFASATVFLVEGEFMAGTLQKIGCPREKIRVRRLGVDPQAHPYIDRRNRDGGDVRILVGGRFVPKKGIPDALKAIVRLAGRRSDVRLTVVGDAGTGHAREQEQKRQILDLLDRSELHGRSEWLGNVPFRRFRELADSHDIFVQASRHAPDGDCEGGAPVSLIQLAATGMPIVATDHCDIPEVVRDGETGLIVPEGDVDALADAIDQMAGSPGMRTAMGRAAHHHICQTYSLEQTVRRLEEIYDEVLAESPGPAGSGRDGRFPDSISRQ